MHDVVLVAYNFSMAPDLTEAINAARKAGMGVVGMKVMAGGAVAVDGRTAQPRPPSRPAPCSPR